MNTNRFTIIGISVLLILIIGVIFSSIRLMINSQPSNTPSIESTPSIRYSIVTTSFPVDDITRKLVSSDFMVTSIGSSADPHDFNPTPQDIITLQEADTIVYTDFALESWLSTILSSLDTQPTTIKASQSITLRKIDEQEHDDHSDEHSSEDTHTNELNHQNQSFDPHFWLLPTNTIIMIETIRDQLISQYPEYQEILTKNAEQLINKYTNLQTEYDTSLSQCTQPIIIQSGHATLGYISDTYNFRYITTQEISPNDEVTSKKIITILDTIQDYSVTTIFADTISNPQITETLKERDNVTVLPIYTGDSKPTDTTIDSLEKVLSSNLNNLKQGLNCKAQ